MQRYIIKIQEQKVWLPFLQNDTQNTYNLLVGLCSNEQNVHKQVSYCAMCLLKFSALQCLHISCLQWERATARVRHPIRLRPPSNQIASAVRSDCVRHPIRLRTVRDGKISTTTALMLRLLFANTQLLLSKRK